MKCKYKTEVYSRVCGFFRPVEQWNTGKKAEYFDRQTYKEGGVNNHNSVLETKQS